MEIYVGIGTILGTALILILRDWRDGKNILKKNEPMNEGFKYMKHHYNDELTTVLTRIQVDQEKSFDDLKFALTKVNDTLIRIEAGGLKIKT